VSLNNPALTGFVLYPQIRALFQGAVVPGLLSLSVTNNGFFQSDSFTSTWDLYADPNYPNTIWGQNNTILLDTQVGLTQPDGSVGWTSLGIFEVSDIEVDQDQGTIAVSGNDLMCRLIRTKTVDSYRNLTSSQIVTKIAQQNGLAADVDPTTTPAGRFYSADFDKLNQDGGFSKTTNQFDLCVELAKYEGYNLWVTGTTLHFKKAEPESSDPWVINVPAPQRAGGTTIVGISNAIGLRLKRSYTLAKDIAVTVKSYSSQAGRFVSGSYGATKNSGNGRNSTIQQFVFSIPNLSQQQCLTYAKNKLAEITRNERVISWSEPMSTILTPRNIVQLTGGGVMTDWQQRYFVISITRHVAFDGGATMEVQARNHSPQTEANQDGEDANDA
jgi:hypothetical protein